MRNKALIDWTIYGNLQTLKKESNLLQAIFWTNKSLP